MIAEALKLRWSFYKTTRGERISKGLDGKVYHSRVRQEREGGETKGCRKNTFGSGMSRIGGRASARSHVLIVDCG